MFDGEVILPVVGGRLVQDAVLFLDDVGGFARPGGLGLVELLVRHFLLLDLLRLLLLGLVLVLDLLDLGLLLLLVNLLVVLNLL